MSRLHRFSIPAIVLSATLAIAFANTTQAAPPSSAAVLGVDVWEHAARRPVARTCIVDAVDYCIWR